MLLAVGSVTVHAEAIEGRDELVNDTDLMLEMDLFNAGPAEQSVEVTGVIQADVLDLLAVVCIWPAAEASPFFAVSHDKKSGKYYSLACNSEYIIKQSFL